MAAEKNNTFVFPPNKYDEIVLALEQASDLLHVASDNVAVSEDRNSPVLTLLAVARERIERVGEIVDEVSVIPRREADDVGARTAADRG